MFIIFIILISYTNCYAVDFEFNDTTYSINYDVPAFPTYNTIYETENIVYYSTYLLFYNIVDNSLDLLCFTPDKYDSSVGITISIPSTRINIRKNGYSGFYDAYSIGRLEGTGWQFDSTIVGNVYKYSPDKNQCVLLYYGKDIIFDVSFYDRYGDGTYTFEDVYKNVGITPEGYTYEPVEIEKEITIKDIYNSLNILTFIVTILLIYLFLKSILRIRG